MGAIMRDSKTNAVIVDEDACTGCGQCIEKCPFGVLISHPDTKKAVKCDLCGGDPRCVDVCPTNVLYYTTLPRFKALKHGCDEKRSVLGSKE